MHFSGYCLESEVPKTVDPCPICGHVALHRHFGGVRSCKGCSAFFRRTILFSKSYRCLRNQKCFIHKGANKHGCQACRFKRCLELGMKMNAVSSSKRSLKCCTQIDDVGSLKQIMRFWSSCYIARYKAMLELSEGNRECLLQSHSRVETTPCSYNQALKIESIVLSDYIHNYDSLFSYDLNFKTQLQNAFTNTWLALRLLSINMKMNSLRHNKVHFLDESYLSIELEKHIDFYRQHSCLWSIETVAKSSIRLAETLNAICRRFARMRVCDVELAVSAHYLIVKSASKVEPNLHVNTDQLTSQLFNDYYKTVCEDPVERIGNLMLVLEMISEVKCSIEEHFTLLALNQRQIESIEDPYIVEY